MRSWNCMKICRNFLCCPRFRSSSLELNEFLTKNMHPMKVTGSGINAQMLSFVFTGLNTRTEDQGRTRGENCVFGGLNTQLSFLGYQNMCWGWIKMLCFSIFFFDKKKNLGWSFCLACKKVQYFCFGQSQFRSTHLCICIGRAIDKTKPNWIEVDVELLSKGWKHPGGVPLF